MNIFDRPLRLYCIIFIAVFFSFNTSLLAENVDISLKRVFQTTGLGNKRDAIYRIDFHCNDSSDIRLENIIVELDKKVARNIDELQVFVTPSAEYYATNNPVLLGCKKAKKGRNNIRLSKTYHVEANNFIWLTCSVKSDAIVGDTVDAIVSSLSMYIDNVKRDITLSEKDGHPEGYGMKIFHRQTFLYVPTTHDCRFYRIPAMVANEHGDIIVAADRRYDSNGDLGEHKIDVAIRRSKDGGKTWSQQQLIAIGDGHSNDAFGYGDAAMVTTNTGRIICLLSAGKNNFFRGMRNIGITHSDDGGITWTIPKELTRNRFTDEVHALSDSLGFWSIFPTSGKGLLLPNGRIMFAANCIDQANTYTIDCYMLYSDDNGESWSIGKGCAYKGSDESKLITMNDGKLLVSVRQDGRRGFNTSSDNGKSWAQQWQTTDMSGNACNADILYYSRETDGKSDIMLHTIINNSDRRNLTLYRSTDQAKSWHELINIQNGGAAYSTMLLLNNGNVALLYEDDSYSADNGYHINFLIIEKEQIMSEMQ